MGLSWQNKGVRTAMSELNKKPRVSLLYPAAGAAAAHVQPLNEVLSRHFSRQVFKRCSVKNLLYTALQSFLFFYTPSR